MTRTTPELAPPSPNFRATPAGGRLATTYDLACNRPHTRRIFSGIGFRTCDPPVPRKYKDVCTKRTGERTGLRHTAGRSPRQAEVHNREKFKTVKSHTADRSPQQVQVTQQAEIHNRQKFKTGKRHTAGDVHNREKSHGAGRKLLNFRKHLVSRSVLQNPPFVMLSPSQQKGETYVI
ncbi:hypothetical protein AVEN_189792-1 [Araneus ventricosus]|uniref:Uncharacterized protein n=1 Tax=Araneus ventricosus TaxID=182803 RepID=A0A4Y2UNS8_ARAVE|nr:hypothetical protein AVEN_189792-1 [Araneus ventricosus]